MESSATPAPIRLSFSGTQRLVLAIAAAGAVVTLCWAALQVRTAKDEARQARENPPVSPATAPVTASGHSGALADLERRLAEEKSRSQLAATEAAARIGELEKVIAFLRQENEAAQKTIERLSGVDRVSTPESQPVQTNTLNKSRDR